jgi:hypothetical protein
MCRRGIAAESRPAGLAVALVQWAFWGLRQLEAADSAIEKPGEPFYKRLRRESPEERNAERMALTETSPTALPLSWHFAVSWEGSIATSKDGRLSSFLLSRWRVGSPSRYGPRGCSAPESDPEREAIALAPSSSRRPTKCVSTYRNHPLRQPIRGPSVRSAVPCSQARAVLPSTTLRAAWLLRTGDAAQSSRCCPATFHVEATRRRLRPPRPVLKGAKIAASCSNQPEGSPPPCR